MSFETANITVENWFATTEDLSLLTTAVKVLRQTGNSYLEYQFAENKHRLYWPHMLTFTAVIKATAAKLNIAACSTHAKCSFRVRLHTNIFLPAFNDIIPIFGYF
jgi:hypothetical protein